MSGLAQQPIVPQGLDPLLLNHWLWWKLLCFEASGDSFQKLFEKVMQRVDPDFVQVRPYGRIGDRKNDGMLLNEDAGVIYQVYSPDEFKQSETIKKIEEDLAGAVKHWEEKGLQRWIFVYNARRGGLPPDIPATLVDQQKKYPELSLGHLSSDDLWELLQGLSLQQRSEVLGAPSGYEHLFFCGGNGASDTLAHIQSGCFILVHDPMVPFNMASIADAIQPQVSLGPPLHITPLIEDEDWQSAFDYQKGVIAEAIQRSGDLKPRFAVFSIAPIPLIVHIGFLLSDRLETDLFQFHRERNEWSWPEETTDIAKQPLATTGLPSSDVSESGSVVLRVSLSEVVRAQDTQAVVGSPLIEIDLMINDPDKGWLQTPEQLEELRKEYLQILKKIRRVAPECTMLHLFYAGPAPGALLLGQCINPRMDPAIALYEYSAQQTPRYRQVAILREDDAL